jgi:integrating conjugative element protein (TIGR03761 family)
MVEKQVKPALVKASITETNELPGPLRNEVVLTTHTREAQKLIVGRKKRLNDPFDLDKKIVENIMGLYSFGKRMNAIWVAAQYDDPYADWFLLQVELALAAGKKAFTNKREELNQLLESVDVIKITTSHSIKPVEANISFANPYGYMGAYLVAEYDALACTLLTAWHIGLIDREPKHALIKGHSKLIRRVFYLSTQWHFTGVTRSAMTAGDPASLEAKAKMGELPQEFLDRSTRAQHAPEIRSVLDFVLPTASGIAPVGADKATADGFLKQIDGAPLGGLGQVHGRGNAVAGS